MPAAQSAPARGHDNPLPPESFAFEEEDSPRRAGTSRRGPGFWLAVAAPWGVVGVLALRGVATAPAPAPSTEETEVIATAPAAASPRLSGPDSLEALSSAPAGPTTAAALDAPTALAILAARAWVSERSFDDDAPRWADHLVIEAIDHPAPDHLVVRVLVLTVAHDGDGWMTAPPLRVAVPVRLDGPAPRIAGDPWPLPVDDVDLSPLPPRMVRPVDEDDHVEIARTLEDAGFADLVVHAIHETDGWPVVATVSARAGEAVLDHQDVWLRRHLGGWAVASTVAR